MLEHLLPILDVIALCIALGLFVALMWPLGKRYENKLAEGDLEVHVEWFNDEGDTRLPLDIEGAKLTRKVSNGWFILYDEDGSWNHKLNGSRVKKISWEDKESGETGYIKTTNRGSDHLQPENNAMEAN